MKFNDSELIEQIRAIGQGLIDNASSIVSLMSVLGHHSPKLRLKKLNIIVLKVIH